MKPVIDLARVPRLADAFEQEALFSTLVRALEAAWAMTVDPVWTNPQDNAENVAAVLRLAWVAASIGREVREG